MTKTATQKTRPGYQMTKLGWIPEDWEVSQLGASTTLLTNGFVGKAKNHYVEDGGVLYLQGYNIHELGFNLSGVKYVSKSFHLKQKKSTLRLNDLLTIQTGDVGLTSMVDEALVGSNCHALIISRLKEDKYYPHFYKLYFNSYIGRGSLKRIETGTTMKHLNIKDMKKWHIPLPPLAEQKKIAKILGTWDDAIANTTELVAQLKARKKGLMQQLLTGSTRLPGFSGEWKEVRLGDYFIEITKKNDGGNHTPLTISSKKGFVSQADKFDRVIAGSSLSKYIQLSKCDFSYNKGNSKTYPMGCVFRLDSFESAVVPFVYISFKPNELVSGDFFFFWFENYGLDRQLKKIITSGARGDGLLNVSKKDFFNLQIPAVSKIEQEAIGGIIRTTDNEIKLQEEKLAQLQATKKGLMQQLLTGEVRVN